MFYGYDPLRANLIDEFGQQFIQELETNTHWLTSLTDVQNDPDFKSGAVDFGLAAALYNAISITDLRIKKKKRLELTA